MWNPAEPQMFKEEDLDAPLMDRDNLPPPFNPDADVARFENRDVLEGRVVLSVLTHDSPVVQQPTSEHTAFLGTSPGSSSRTSSEDKTPKFPKDSTWGRKLLLKGFRRPYFVWAIFATCVGMFLWEIERNNWKIESYTDNPLLGPPGSVLVGCGAKETILIVDHGEWWRLMSAMWLHAGVLHLLFNMIGLFNLGVSLELELGITRVALIYFASGVVGTATSAVFLPQVVMVGASGSVLGLFGASTAEFLTNFRDYKGRRGCIALQLFLALCINLIIGLTPYVDNFAHLGGMVTGFTLGLFLTIHFRQ